MFRPAKIYHTTVMLKEDKVDELIKKLYELGLCELKESELDISSKYSYDAVKNLDEIQTRFNFIIDSLEEYREVIEPGHRIKKLLSPDAPIKHKSMLHSTQEIVEEVEYHLGLIEPKITERLDKLDEIKEAIQNNRFTISNLELIPDVETNVFKSSDNIKVFMGLVATSSLSKIKSELNDIAVIATKEKDKTQSFITIFTIPEDSSNIEKTLHIVGFQNLDIIYEDKKPIDIIQNIKKDIDKLETEERKIKKFLKKTQKLYEKKFELLSEELEIAKQKILALENFKTTKSFSVLEAWVPQKDFEKFHQIVKETSKQYYIEIDEKDEAPTLFNNSKLVKPFEMITELYSPPKYGGFDPTPLLAITFTLFFGFMLTDVAYGLMLIALGWVMVKGIGKFDEAMKKFAMLLIFFGISTTLMGIVFGSYFGNFFQDIGINLPIPIDSMKQIMLTLSIALALGSLHLIMGLVAGFYENIHKGSFKNAMEEQGVWMIFMIGLISYLFKLNTLGLTAILTAVALKMFFSFLKGGAVTSIISVFDFSGFIGDIFSYARLMALAIGTAGISLAVNFMVFMVIDLIPWAGYILAIFIFIVGHLFNIAMNGLGAFIHTTRLHFLEFFTKFYDGGGRTYKPFLAERKNTFIKIDEGGQ